MATTYYLTTTASDLDPGAETWSNAVSTTAPGTTTLTSTIANGDGMAGTIDSSDYAFTPSGDPGTTGVTGTYTLSVVVSTGDSNVTLVPQLARVNSGGTVQTGPTGSDGGGQALSAGTKTFTWTSLNLGTWASGDRLRIYYDYDNASTHGGAEVVVQDIGSAGTTISAPWTATITKNPTALNAGPTYGTHAAQIQDTATALDAGPTLGTHAAQLQVPATALDSGPTYGTHATQIQDTATALDASATLGTHSAGLSFDATALDASATLGTHACALQSPATGLDAGPTLGTHAAQLRADGTALDAGPTFGTHACQILDDNHTALNAGPTLGTHEANVAGGDITKNPTALDASATLGTHACALQSSATGLGAGPTLGTHAAQLQSAATALDASATLGTHTASTAGGTTTTPVSDARGGPDNSPITQKGIYGSVQPTMRGALPRLIGEQLPLPFLEVEVDRDDDEAMLAILLSLEAASAL